MALTKLNYTGQGTIPDASLPTIPIGKIPTITGAKMPTGSVIQQVHTAHATQVQNNTTTLVDTGLTGSITPSSSSNKILVFCTINGVYKDGNAAAGIQIRLLRGSTEIARLANRAGGDNGTGSAATMSIGTVSADVLDSPSTTSAITYKAQFMSASNAAATYVQVYGAKSTLVLQEIKG